MDVQPSSDDQAWPVRDTGPIVVGVSADDGTASAVVWAVDEAERTGRGLRLVSACDEPDDVGPATPDVTGLARRLTLSPLEHRVKVGHPSVVLVESASDGSLLVVGRRRRGWLRRGWSGGTSLDVATHARVPVVVVPETWIQPSLCAAPIVLGIEPEDITVLLEPGRRDALHDAIAFAFDRAAALRVPLDVVSAWTVPGAFARNPRAIAACRDRFAADLEIRLRPWRSARPEVELRVFSVAAAAVPALLEAGGKAQLTVIGRDTGRHLPGVTTRALIHRSRRPIAVVPVARSEPDRLRDEGWAT